MKMQKAIVYRKNDEWVAETEDGIVHVILNQKPFHSVLSIGRDENREIMVEVLDGMIGPRADFREFVRNA